MNIISHKNTFYKVALLSFISLFYTANVASYVATDASASVDKNWRFKVFLDDTEIGFHNFSMVHKDDHKEIYSKARFDVKFLFITVYSYEHDNIEQWDGQCLKSINAVTNDNGEKYNVSGKIDSDAFIVNTIDKVNTHLPCVKTFAYWDPGFLKESMLLNSQTGEMIKVNSEFLGNEILSHKGEDISARRYRLNGEKIQIDLWYSDDNHWLALESLTEDGSIVRYTMQ